MINHAHIHTEGFSNRSRRGSYPTFLTLNCSKNRSKIINLHSTFAEVVPELSQPNYYRNPFGSDIPPPTYHFLAWLLNTK